MIMVSTDEIHLRQIAVEYAQEYCKNLQPTDLAVIIFGDSGRAYLTKNFYNENKIFNETQSLIPLPSYKHLAELTTNEFDK